MSLFRVERFGKQLSAGRKRVAFCILKGFKSLGFQGTARSGFRRSHSDKPGEVSWC